MKRRTLLQDIAVGGAVVAAASLPYGMARLLAPDDGKAKPKRNYLRPPGALKNDAAFIAACIGCGLCGEVCPPRCILFHTRDGGIKVNTPYIDPENKACILCNKCMEVCPTESLTMIAMKDIDMGLAVIDETACYPWVDRGICGACVSICPLGTRAIAFKMWNQYRPYIKDGCVGCGICVEVCPHPSIPIWIVERPRKSVGKGAA
jgi:ferredoxin